MAEFTNKRWERFCLLIIGGELSQGQAYVQAGFKVKNPETAMVNASRLLRNAKVIDRLAELRVPQQAIVEQTLDRYAVTTDRIIRRLACLGFVDPRAYVKKKEAGNEVFKPISDLTEEEAAALKLIRMPDGSIRAELRDPSPALVRLGQHMGLFSGEAATPMPAGDTHVHNDTRTLVYVDASPRETAEQWEARQRRRFEALGRETPSSE